MKQTKKEGWTVGLMPYEDGNYKTSFDSATLESVFFYHNLRDRKSVV